MDAVGLKSLIVSGRELVTTAGTFIAKYLPFPAENISGLIVFFLSFWIASSILNIFPNFKKGFLIKLVGASALFYFLWLW